MRARATLGLLPGACLAVGLRWIASPRLFPPGDLATKFRFEAGEEVFVVEVVVASVLAFRTVVRVRVAIGVIVIVIVVVVVVVVVHCRGGCVVRIGVHSGVGADAGVGVRRVGIRVGLGVGVGAGIVGVGVGAEVGPGVDDRVRISVRVGINVRLGVVASLHLRIGVSICVRVSIRVRAGVSNRGGVSAHVGNSVSPFDSAPLTSAAPLRFFVRSFSGPSLQAIRAPSGSAFRSNESEQLVRESAHHCIEIAGPVVERRRDRHHDSALARDAQCTLEHARRKRCLAERQDEPHPLLERDLGRPGDERIADPVGDLGERRGAARNDHERIVSVGPRGKWSREIGIAKAGGDVALEILRLERELVREQGASPVRDDQVLLARTAPKEVEGEDGARSTGDTDQDSHGMNTPAAT